MARQKGTDVTIFTIGGKQLLGVLTEVTITTNIADEDGSGINEVSENPEPVSRARQITGSALVEEVVALMAIAESNNPIIAFSTDTGAGTYTGTALVTMAEHAMKRKALQTERFTLKIKGSPTLVLPT